MHVSGQDRNYLMIRNQRKRRLVDRHVQDALVRRAVVYVLLSMVLVALLSALWLAMSEGPITGRQVVEQMWVKFGPAWLASILLIPIAGIDCIRLGNRFAGPMLRLWHAMKEVAAGNAKDVDLIKLRKRDFWYDFAEDFNRMLLEKKLAETLAEIHAKPSEATHPPLRSGPREGSELRDI